MTTLFISAIALCMAARVQCMDIFVKTRLGTVTGSLDTSLDIPVEAFRGIPFARPPIKQRRFTLPEPYGEFGDLNATYYRPACVQSILAATVNTSEDCLHLNVFRRQGLASSGLVPVIVMIHGGAYAFGSTQEFSYNGVPLAAYGDVIVVTIQYRLGIFGFAYSDLIPGNIGLYDQKLAIEWVHNNIQYFGGDNQQITLMGVSAGSMSVSAHIISTETRGRNLFQSVIMDAGVIFGLRVSPEEAATRMRIVAEKVGCATSGDAMLGCLRDVDAEELAQASFDPEGYSPSITFVPITDGRYLPKDLRDDLEENSDKYAKVRMLIGTARDEGSMFVGFGFTSEVPRVDTDDEFVQLCAQRASGLKHEVDFSDESFGEVVKHTYLTKYPDRLLALSRFVGDGLFHCSVNAFVKQYSKHQKSDIFVYQFNRVLNRPYLFMKPAKLGAFHWSPHIHFTGSLMTVGESVDPKDREYFLDSISMISAFVRGKSPVFRDVSWPDFVKTNQILLLDEKPEVGSDLQHQDECKTVFSYYETETKTERYKSEL